MIALVQKISPALAATGLEGKHHGNDGENITSIDSQNVALQDAFADLPEVVKKFVLQTTSPRLQLLRARQWRDGPPNQRKLVEKRYAELVAPKVSRPRATTKLPAVAELPPHGQELLALPHGLGDVQRWIHGRMIYPDAATAGVTALALLAHFAMAHVTVNSYGGLGLNEQFMILAPTGYGKEDARRPFDVIDKALRKMQPPADAGNLWTAKLPSLQYSATASAQGLHSLLLKNRAQTFLADEFGEWLGQAASDSHKQMALAYIMQCYSKATGTAAVPHAITRDYPPVEKPRVIVFATSTAERMLEAMTSSQADSGALNRFVIFVASPERIEKRYEGLILEPPQTVIDLIAWIVALPETSMEFTPDGWEYFKKHDSEVIEPLRFQLPALAGRLSEQAIKIGALIALSRRRIVIDSQDLALAYAIRENLYQRAAALIGMDGTISGQHLTGIAYEQLTGAFSRHDSLWRSKLVNYSRVFKKLSMGERNAVISALVKDGVCREEPKQPGLLFAM